MRARVPDISEQLEAVVLKCLEKDPEDRFHSALALKAAIDEAIFGRNANKKTQLLKAMTQETPDEGDEGDDIVITRPSTDESTSEDSEITERFTEEEKTLVEMPMGIAPEREKTLIEAPMGSEFEEQETIAEMPIGDEYEVKETVAEMPIGDEYEVAETVAEMPTEEMGKEPAYEAPDHDRPLIDRPTDGKLRLKRVFHISMNKDDVQNGSDRFQAALKIYLANAVENASQAPTKKLSRFYRQSRNRILAICADIEHDDSVELAIFTNVGIAILMARVVLHDTGITEGWKLVVYFHRQEGAVRDEEHVGEEDEIEAEFSRTGSAMMTPFMLDEEKVDGFHIDDDKDEDEEDEDEGDLVVEDYEDEEEEERRWPCRRRLQRG